MPTLSPAPGSYGSSPTVTLSGPSGASLYYTTNGLQPTSSSTAITSGSTITVAANEIVQVVAIQPGYTDSFVAGGAYQINTPNVVNFPSSFAANDGVILCGRAVLVSGAIQLVDTAYAGSTNEMGAAWFGAPVNITSGWSTTFQVKFASASGRGVCFVLQNQPAASASSSSFASTGGPTAYGPGDLAMGYGNPNPGGSSLYNSVGGILSSVAIAFDLYSVANSVGLYTNGATPSGNQTATGLTFNGNTLTVVLSYSGTTLSININSGAFTHNWTGINIPSIVGGNTAYPGFTAGTGGVAADISIENWIMT